MNKRLRKKKAIEQRVVKLECDIKAIACELEKKIEVLNVHRRIQRDIINNLREAVKPKPSFFKWLFSDWM